MRSVFLNIITQTVASNNTAGVNNDSIAYNDLFSYDYVRINYTVFADPRVFTDITERIYYSIIPHDGTVFYKRIRPYGNILTYFGFF